MVTLDIKSQPIGAALTEFARQSGVQILFYSDVSAGISVPGLSGSFTPDVALTRLLSNTGLTYEYINARTVAIHPVVSTVSEGKTTHKESGLPAIRLANLQIAEKSDETTQRIGNQEPDRPSSSDKLTSAVRLEEIVVTGTHIRGLLNTATPVYSIARSDLERTGFTSLQDVFRSLPQNLSEISDEGSLAVGTSRTASSNAQNAQSISLRGLGPEATLVLLNGKRRPGNINGRVFDIAAVPLSAVDRIDISTGGRSAIYGSDAIAGVVNLVLRDSFEGLETQGYYGASDAGGERKQASQLAGAQFERGGVIVAVDYSEQDRLDASETGVMRLPGTSGLVPRPGAFDLIPKSWRRSGYTSGHFMFNDAVELYGNALYSSNQTRQTFAFSVPNLTQRSDTESDQYSAALGMKLKLPADWRIDISGNAGEIKNREQVTFVPGAPGGSKTHATLSSGSVVADGPLPTFAGREMKLAIGAEYRKDEYARTRITTGLHAEDDHRTVSSAFAEASVPIIEGEGTGLDASVAARYDDYSDFGNTFNPQAGIVWRPMSGVALRAAYAEAFRAPDLFTLDFAPAITLANLRDINSSSGTSPALVYGGGNPSLDSETAKTWNMGFDYEPAFVEGAKLSVSYFNIDFTDRIDEPAPGADVQAALQRPEVYGAFINRSPTAAELAGILSSAPTINNFTGVAFNPADQNITTVFPNLVVIDNRFQNIGRQRVQGLDFDLSHQSGGRFGDFSFGVFATYFLKFERKSTPNSPTFDQLNTPGKPVDFRLRAHLGWSRSVFQTDVYVNHVDSYNDNLVSPGMKIDAWTTVDLTLQTDVSQLIGARPQRLSAALSATNLLDEPPPVFLHNRFGLGYDAANASAMGRFLSLRILMRW